jgi:hypothetical protein
VSRKRTLVLFLALSLVSIALFACGPSKAELAAQQRDQCFSNEQRIKLAMDLVNADTGVYPDIGSVMAKLQLKCPSGGTYTFDEKTDTVTCSIHGHR